MLEREERMRRGRGGDVGEESEEKRKQVLTRGEEACRSDSRKSVDEIRWEKRRCVLFKGVDV